MSSSGAVDGINAEGRVSFAAQMGGFDA